MTFQLTRMERADPLFLKLKAHYEQKLANLRAMNDNDNTHEATAGTRGRIKECKLFLSLDQDQPVIE